MFPNFLLQAAAVTDTAVGNTTATIATNAATTENVSYLSFLLKGGFLIIPITLLLFFCIYVIVERYMTIQKMGKQNINLLADIKLQLKSGKIDQAVMLCDRENTSSAHIMRSGISIIGRPINEIESVMEKTANIEIAHMEKGLGYLGLISGIAPILGFIGTISGVIKIFYSISVTENISIGNISGGLYEKMISSGAGLVVGVVAYSAYHLFNMMIDQFSLKAQKQILEVINTIQEP